MDAKIEKKETIPEKARLLKKLKAAGFNVPDFIYVPADDFEEENFDQLDIFLSNHKESFKVIVRSAHPDEDFYRGGTFDSVETYADVGGVRYARKRMIRLAGTSKWLSIHRQQVFNNAPEIDPADMGVVVMPFIEGSSAMAKVIGEQWEFGYCRDRMQKMQTEPYITNTPHDLRLLQLSDDIQKLLGFRCEIEYIISSDGEIHVVQAKDISDIETLEQKESERSIKLEGIRRIRKRRSYRERPIYVMDNRAFFLDLISQCEDLIHECEEPKPTIEEIIAKVRTYENELESFAMRHHRFGVLGIAIHDTDDLFQVANHYLDDMPELQTRLSKVLHNSLYSIDIFLSEADTLIAKDRFRINLCSHDAYGIDTVRNPMWNVYWSVNQHNNTVKEFKRLGFKTGDTIGIDIDSNGKPMVFRL